MNVSEDLVLIPVYLEPHKDVDTVISWLPWRTSACFVPDWVRIPRVLTRMAHSQGFMLPHHLFFSSLAHTAAPSHLPFNKPAVKPHYQGSLSNNWLPPSVHPFPFCVGEGGFALSRRATADNKSKWQAHSQRPPLTKASCLMNHRHWQPNLPAPFSLHIPNANGGSIPGPHLQFIISWLFAVTLFTVWLSISSAACRCPLSAEKHNLRRWIYAYWLNGAVTRPPQRSRLTRAPKGQSEQEAEAWSRWFCQHTCVKLQLKGDSECWARSLPTAHFKCHW